MSRTGARRWRHRLVVDRPGLENGFGGLEDGLHFPQLTIRKRNREEWQLAVAAQHIEPVEAGILGDTGRIDRELPLVRRCQEPTIPGIADQLFVTLLEFATQTRR